MLNKKKFNSSSKKSNSHRNTKKDSSPIKSHTMNSSSNELVNYDSDALHPSSFMSNTMKEILRTSFSSGTPGIFAHNELSTLRNPSYSTISPTTSTSFSVGQLSNALRNSINNLPMNNRTHLDVNGSLDRVNLNAGFRVSESQLIYNSHFSGLQSIGASGMTILEELIDLAMKACENGRIANNHVSRGAALLEFRGKVYSGCDIGLSVKDICTMTAEKAAINAALSDGASKFECIVICSDTMPDFPSPSGESRELLRKLGVFPVILVNCNLAITHTSTQELYPMLDPVVLIPNNAVSREITSANELENKQSQRKRYLDSIKPSDWNLQDVREWLHLIGLIDIMPMFAIHNINGKEILKLDEFTLDKIGIDNVLKRRKLLREVEILKVRDSDVATSYKNEDLDEYVDYLQKHKIKQIADLKVIFDQFCSSSKNSLSVTEIEKLLLFLKKDITRPNVENWLNQIRNDDKTIDFIGFVEGYNRYFGVDNIEEVQTKTLSEDCKVDENSGVPYDDELNLKKQEDEISLESNSTISLVILVRLKNIFDQFQINDKLTSAEAIQGLTEAGIAATRSEMIQYFRGRNCFDFSERNISFFEFIRCYTSIKKVPFLTSREFKRIKSSKTYHKNVSLESPREEFYVGMQVAVWNELSYSYKAPAIIKRIHGDRTFDVSFENGERENNVHNEKLITWSKHQRNLEEKKLEKKKHFEQHQSISCNYKNRGKWYPGKISRDRGDGTYDISYDDGESEMRVSEDLIRSLERADSPKKSSSTIRLREGDKVEGNYRGRGKWYPGKISRDRGDGTYDINYDDGESEMRVSDDLLRLSISSRPGLTRSKFINSLDID